MDTRECHSLCQMPAGSVGDRLQTQRYNVHYMGGVGGFQRYNGLSFYGLEYAGVTRPPPVMLHIKNCAALASQALTLSHLREMKYYTAENDIIDHVLRDRMCCGRNDSVCFPNMSENYLLDAEKNQT